MRGLPGVAPIDRGRRSCYANFGKLVADEDLPAQPPQRSPVTKIIDIENRLRLGQKKRAKVEKAKKLEAVRKILQCTRCLARCAKCGIQFETQAMYKRFKGPFRFCETCQEEYEDFLKVKEKGEESRYYWHNQEWLKAWQCWLDYQQALKAYGESPEFIDLIREVEWEK